MLCAVKMLVLDLDFSVDMVHRLDASVDDPFALRRVSFNAEQRAKLMGKILPGSYGMPDAQTESLRIAF